jgi:hypothetical protein
VPVWETFGNGLGLALDELEAKGESQAAVDLIGNLLSSEVSFAGAKLSDQADLRAALLVREEELRKSLEQSRAKENADNLSRRQAAMLVGQDVASGALAETYANGGDISAAKAIARASFKESRAYEALSDIEKGFALRAFDEEADDFAKRSQRGDASIYDQATRDIQEGRLAPSEIRDFLKSEDGQALSVEQRINLENTAARYADATDLFNKAPAVRVALSDLQSSAFNAEVPRAFSDGVRSLANKETQAAFRDALALAREVSGDPTLTDDQKVAKVNAAVLSAQENRLARIDSYAAASRAQYDEFTRSLQADKDSLDFEAAIQRIEENALLNPDARVALTEEFQGYQSATAELREQAIREARPALDEYLRANADINAVTGASFVDPAERQRLENSFLASYAEKARELNSFVTLRSDNSSIVRDIVNELLGTTEEAQPIGTPTESEPAPDPAAVRAAISDLSANNAVLAQRRARSTIIMDAWKAEGFSSGVTYSKWGTRPTGDSAERIYRFAAEHPDAVVNILGPTELTWEDLERGAVIRGGYNIPLLADRSVTLSAPLFDSEKSLLSFIDSDTARGRSVVAKMLDELGLDDSYESVKVLRAHQASLIRLYRQR